MAASDLVGALAHRVGFERAQRRWFRERRTEVAAELGSAEHEAWLSRLAPGPVGRPAHVVVVPQEGEDFDSFRPGTRNFYWEAAQCLRELAGEHSVSVLSVPRGEAPSRWHARLLEHVMDSGATHVLTHIESDPGSEGQAWTWDVPWTALADRWDGVLLGVMFDSAFEWITAKSRLLARVSPRFMAVDICMPMDGVLARGRPEVGPVNMPLSQVSLDMVRQRLEGVQPRWDLSFIGAMYPYRVELVERLRAEGVSVAVNPHRQDPAEDFASSRSGQPEWLEYMAGLRSSLMTLNFSRSSAGPYEQLKTRVLEATLAGTLLLTDDRDRTRLFWTPEAEYGYFGGIDDVPAVVRGFLADPQRLSRTAVAGEARAWSLANTDFWARINRGLERRGLTKVSTLGL